LTASSADRRSAEREPQRAARQRQHHAFGEQLLQQPPAACADGGADRDLALAGRRTRQEQVRHVRTRNQQHEADRADEDKQRRAYVLDERFLKRHHAEAGRRSECGWEFGSELGCGEL